MLLRGEGGWTEGEDAESVVLTSVEALLASVKEASP